MGNKWLEHLDQPSPFGDSAGDPSAPPPPPPCRHALLSFSSAVSSPSSSASTSSPADPPPRFVCARCRADLTLLSDVVWEGVMGQRSEPAFLSRRTVNVDEAPPVRRDVALSSGRYDLVDVECRGCRGQLGWKYLKRSGVEGERFKVGCTLLASARMRRVSGFDGVVVGGDGDEYFDDEEEDEKDGEPPARLRGPSSRSRRRVVGTGRFL